MIKRGDDEGWLRSDGDGIQNFTCKCDKCGSTNVEIISSLSMGSEWTGQYGSMDLNCKDCDNQAELYS